MGKTVTVSAAVAVAILLLNLCPSSYGKDVLVASLHSNNDERRSLRRGMTAATSNEKKSNGIEEEATQQSVKFHTKISEAAASSTMKKNKRVPLNNKFYDMSDVTEKEVSLKCLYVPLFNFRAHDVELIMKTLNELF